MDGESAATDARKGGVLPKRRRLEGRLTGAVLERFGLDDVALEPLRLGEGFAQVLRVSRPGGESGSP
jgi:hypothetical protein